MTIKMNNEAGDSNWNGVETTIDRTRSLKVKSGVKAGPRHELGHCLGLAHNHNETQVRTRGFKVKSGVKAGPHYTQAVWAKTRY